jgi:hypothetical protein
MPSVGANHISFGGIEGRVNDADTKESLLGANITLVDKFAGAMTDETGHFSIAELSPGEYTLQISHVGYETRLIEKTVDTGQIINLSIELTEKPISLKGITVTPSRFTIMGSEPVAQQSLTRQELQTVPQLASDFFRSVNRLPGVTGNDFSTRISVRGGEYDEILVTLDGLQIYEPFHLKDIDGGVMSAIDVDAVDGIDLMTGGFPANYGDKMSAAFNIKSKRVTAEKTKLSLGLSITNATALAEGTFRNNKGSWMISARRGYIDLLLKLAGADDNLKPTYYDMFGKVRYNLGANHALTAHFLHAGDDMKFIGEDSDEGDTLITKYGNTYGWLTLNSLLHPRLSVRSIASVGKVDHNRRGHAQRESDQEPHQIAHDIEDFRFVGFKSDWEYEAFDRYLIKWGFDARKMNAEYDYSSRLFRYTYQTVDDSFFVELDRIDTTQAIFEKSGNKLSGYISNRFRIAKPFTIEFGFRQDYTSYSDDNNKSPRLNAVLSVGPRTTIRGGWGHFYQSEGIDEISVGDGETDFFPAEKAEHWVLGLEHKYESGVRLRLEGYLKNYSNLRPDLRNTFDDIEAFPESEDDRNIAFREKSTSKGIEIYLKKETGGKFSWRTSYALAKIEDSINYIRFMPEDMEFYHDIVLPSPHDLRHTFYLDMSYRPSHNWQINLAWQYHSGWPYTDVYLATYIDDQGNNNAYLQADKHLGSRHKGFNRIDLRINRYFNFAGGRVIAYLGLINMFGRKNVRMYDYDINYSQQFGFYMSKNPEHWFGRLPAFGISYEAFL